MISACHYWMSQNQFFVHFGEGGNHVNHDAEVDKISYLKIVKKSWPYLITGYVNYATSLSVFPAVTSLGISKVLYSIVQHKLFILEELIN